MGMRRRRKFKKGKKKWAAKFIFASWRLFIFLYREWVGWVVGVVFDAQLIVQVSKNESTGGDWNLVLITHTHTESWITYQGCIMHYLLRYVHVCHTVYSLDKRILCLLCRSALLGRLVWDIWLLFLSDFVTPSIERVEHIMYLVYLSFNLQIAYPLCCECSFLDNAMACDEILSYLSVLCMAWNTRT